MKGSENKKRLRNLICILSIIFFLLSGCQPVSNTVETTAPPPPASLNVVDRPEEATNLPEDEEGLIIEISQAENGLQNVNITIPQVLPEGNFIGIFESEDGEQYSVPCEKFSGSGNQVECPLVLIDNSPTIHFQLDYYKETSPLFGNKIGFSEDVMDVFIQPQKFVLSPAYPQFETLSPLEQDLYMSNLCENWALLDGKPDDLDAACYLWYATAKTIPIVFDWYSSFNIKDSLAGLADFLNSLPTHASMPNPDCAGKDAGSFWCQENDETPYIAGQLANFCREELGINFEDPLTAIDDPLTTFEDPLTAFEDPLTAFEDPLTAFEDPLTAFEDPLTAFEDPLTAFEDPLTAFEDPLTAFEDPLTAFEDPLTAQDVTRITLLYTAMRPFLKDTSYFPACDNLAMLGDYSWRLKTGKSLFSVIRDHFSVPQKFTGSLEIQPPLTVDTGEHCSAFFKTQISTHWFYAMPNDPRLQVNFQFTNDIPGINFENRDDLIPFIYTARIGGVESEGCSLSNLDPHTIKCLIRSMDPDLFGTTQPVSFFVSGCEHPIYQSNIVLPAYDYSRCDIFNQFDNILHTSRASTSLQFYVTHSSGINGSNTWDMSGYPGFDQMPLSYYAYFDDISTMELVNSDDNPGALFVNFEVPYAYLVSNREFKLYTNMCESPIFSKTIQVLKPVVNPTPTQPGNVNPPPVVCAGPLPGTCQTYDWGSCRCTKCAEGYVDPDLDGVCSELN